MINQLPDSSLGLRDQCLGVDAPNQVHAHQPDLLIEEACKSCLVPVVSVDGAWQRVGKTSGQINSTKFFNFQCNETSVITVRFSTTYSVWFLSYDLLCLYDMKFQVKISIHLTYRYMSCHGPD